MPVYKTTINGVAEPRYVKADSAAQARNHIVTAEPLSADELSDAIDEGAKIEKAGKTAATED